MTTQQPDIPVRPAAPVVTSSQMRALESAAIAAGVTEDAMMEAAGLAAAQEAWMNVGALDSGPIVVLVGPGKNGSDGLIAARHLKEWEGQVYLYLLRRRAEDDPAWRACVEAGIPATVLADDTNYEMLEHLLSAAATVLDALFGTGFDPIARPIEGDARAILARLRAAREATPPVGLIALDLPSGLDADGRGADPITVEADVTLAFGAKKVGHVTAPGLTLCGRVEAIEIGLPGEALDALPFGTVSLREIRDALPERPDSANKGTFGTVVVAAGSRRYPGAVRLAAEAAARTGAGLVNVAAPASIQPIVAALPDVTHEPLPEEGEEQALGPEAARRLLQAMRREERDRALLIGPGIGRAAETRTFVHHLLNALDEVAGLRGVVLDADALHALTGESAWHERIVLPRVLTPHPGEMARLTGLTTEQIERDRLAVAVRVAEETQSVVVLKGAGTVIAAPDGRARISPVATSALAHAGTGDVLAGLVTGFIAQGMPAFEAACAAVYLHTDCARLVAATNGPAATLASDLLRVLPEARRSLDRPAATGLGIGSGMPPMGGDAMGAMFGGGMGGGMPGGGGMGGGNPFGGFPGLGG